MLTKLTQDTLNLYIVNDTRMTLTFLYYIYSFESAYILHQLPPCQNCKRIQ